MSTNGIKTYLTDHDIDSLSSETLTTEDKTLVGAINELTEMSSDMTVVDDGDGNIILGADATTIVVPKNSNEIDYDNTESGLIATNVQGAIDEIGASLNTLNSNLTSHMKSNTFCMSYTKMNVGGNGKTTVDVNFSDVSTSINFVDTPVIIATLESDWTDALKLTINNTSTTGFSIIVHNSIATGTQVVVHWLARGYVA